MRDHYINHRGLNDNQHHLEGYDYYNSYYGTLQYESIIN